MQLIQFLNCLIFHRYSKVLSHIGRFVCVYLLQIPAQIYADFFSRNFLLLNDNRHAPRTGHRLQQKAPVRRKTGGHFLFLIILPTSSFLFLLLFQLFRQRCMVFPCFFPGHADNFRNLSVGISYDGQIYRSAFVKPECFKGVAGKLIDK